MFIKTEQVRDWRDLQEKVCQLFQEMGYDAEIGKKVNLAGRGEKEIDVFVTDPSASYNKVYLIECKHWSSNVPQEVIHSFKTVMEEAGANTGFVISKLGFQVGAYSAARFTNIELLTFEELQHLYGDEWFRKQMQKLNMQVDRLKEIHRLHFDQLNTLGFHNNVFFHTKELQERLFYFNKWVVYLGLDAAGQWPESYMGPEPVKMAHDPFNPLKECDGWHEIPTVRMYFNTIILAAKKCADEFEQLKREAKKSFDTLKVDEQGVLFETTRQSMIEEMPVRALKRHLESTEYQRILNRLLKMVA